MYVEVPTKVSAIEFINSPDTPKSQILICPLELKRILEGLISIEPPYERGEENERQQTTLTTFFPDGE